MSKTDPRVKALIEKIAKDTESAIVIGGEFKIDVVPTGISSFDASTGVGGFPRGRCSLVQGEEGSGKTLLTLATIANVQRSGGRAAFIDLEHALTPSFASLLGVNYDDLIISRPRTLNHAYDIIKPLASSGLFDIIVGDSAVALATIDDLEKSSVDSTSRAGVAGVHSEELRKLVSMIHEQTAFVWINQLREDPNPPKWWRGGKILYAPGGRALRHYSSMTVDVKKGESYEKAGTRIGQLTKTHIIKNKVGTPYRKAEFKLMYEGGLDLTTSMIDTCLELGIITREGSFYYLYVYGEADGEIAHEYKWQGRAKMEEAIEADEGLQAVLQAYLTEATSGEEDE